ncbi:MAG TPA: hypothetical protein VI566_12925 [Xanthomonadales bacterium]|nr:hypothetical protein [Xanthomonadales bacterium]
MTEAGFAAFVGIDWADVQHDVCLQAVGSKAFEFSTLEHTPVLPARLPTAAAV